MMKPKLSADNETVRVRVTPELKRALKDMEDRSRLGQAELT